MGTFNVGDISSFIEGVLRGKLEAFEIPKLNYIERDCKAVEERQESNEDDEILKEILKSAEDKGTKTQKTSDTKRGRRKKPKNKPNDDL